MLWERNLLRATIATSTPKTNPATCASQAMLVSPPDQQELGQKPDSQEEHRRQSEGPEEERRDYRSHPGPREEDRIGAHHPGDGARGTDHRKGRLGLQEDVGPRGEQTRHQVEDEVGEVAEGILDVVAEYEEHPQVGEKVSDAAVEEDRGEDGEPDVLVGVEPDCRPSRKEPRRSRPPTAARRW